MKAFFALIAVLFTSAIFASPASADQVLVDFGPAEPLQIVRGDTRISLLVEVANDPAERAQGMMFRTEMADDQGMLFDFDRVRLVNMWMKSTLISLDMIFLDQSGKIVTIARNAKPESLRRISSGVAVAAVLEVNGGLALQWGLKRGDQVMHGVFGNAPEAIVQSKVSETTDN